MWPDIGGRCDCQRVVAFPLTWMQTWLATEVCFVLTPHALNIGSYHFLLLLKSDIILPTADAALVQHSRQRYRRPFVNLQIPVLKIRAVGLLLPMYPSVCVSICAFLWLYKQPILCSSSASRSSDLFSSCQHLPHIAPCPLTPFNWLQMKLYCKMPAALLSNWIYRQ